jgi:hypothetical protein
MNMFDSIENLRLAEKYEKRKPLSFLSSIKESIWEHS